MKKIIQKLTIPIIAALLLLTYSCNKAWDDNYVTPAYASNGNLLSIINKNANYSQFSSLLKKSGYDSVLRRTDQYTVLAVKNGGFTAVDTTNITLVKRVIAMHLIPSAIYSQNMNNTSYIAISGKPVYFTAASNSQTANGATITPFTDRSVNGVVYDIAQAIVPAPNIFEAIQGNSNFSLFNSYIVSNYTLIPDPAKNSVIGTDATGAPIYRLPVIYIPSSAYLNAAKINDERTVSTAFIPTNAVVNTVLSRMLAARANIATQIIPRVGAVHNDTTIAGNYFIPKNITYAGDSSILRDYLFRHIVVRGNIPTLSATNTFNDFLGNPFTVTSSQVTGNAVAASNGTYYTLNDVTLPAEVYRPKYIFSPVSKNAAGTNVNNPNITYTGGSAYGSEVNNVVSNDLGTSYRLFSSRFNFNRIGSKIDFVIPSVAHGKYKVLLKNYLDNNGAVVSANYGSQLLKQNYNASTLYTSQEVVVDVDLGTINVATDGSVDLTFTCAGVSLKTAGQYLFTVDTITLIPVAP